MNVVFDCNIIISFLLSRGQVISSLFNYWSQGKFLVLISDEIMQEIEEVIIRFVTKGLIQRIDADVFLDFLKINALLVNVKTRCKLSKDKKDNRYINCAIDGEADYLVTGDKKHLLNLKKVGRAKIISARELSKILWVIDKRINNVLT